MKYQRTKRSKANKYVHIDSVWNRPVHHTTNNLVKLAVELISCRKSEEMMSVSEQPSAFDVMMAAQRWVQLADNRFLEHSKSNKDRLYNDAISLRK